MKKSDGTGMRYISGILFGVLGLYNLFLTNYYLNFYGLSGAPLYTIIVIATAILFIAVSIKLLSQKGEVPSVWRRGLVVGTVFYVLFSFLTIRTQLEMISWSIFSAFKSTTEFSAIMNTLTEAPSYKILSVVLFAISVLLAVVAAFFASMSVSEADSVEYIVTDTIVETADTEEETVTVEEVATEKK